VLTGCPVALKLIPKISLLKNVKLHQEIFILKKIRNWKYMMRLLEVFEDHENLYLIMEFHNRGDLITYLNNRTLLSEEELAPLFKKIVFGIRTLHKLNIIHRDIKMDNILLDRKSQPVISDFGISSLVQPDTLIKDTGGTPAYLAPEVINALGGICYKTDVWGLGVLLYTLVFGILPFKGSDFQELYKNILSENFDFPARAASDSLKDLIRRMLKVSIKARLDVEGILVHEWLKRHTTEGSDFKETTDDLPKLSQKTKDLYLRHLNDVGFPMDHLYESLSRSKMNHATACFENLRLTFE
jgi:serine/threonine protein kinase